MKYDAILVLILCQLLKEAAENGGKLPQDGPDDVKMTGTPAQPLTAGQAARQKELEFDLQAAKEKQKDLQNKRDLLQAQINIKYDEILEDEKKVFTLNGEVKDQKQVIADIIHKLKNPQ